MDLNESFSPLWKELNFSLEGQITANITVQKYTHQASARIVLLAGNYHQPHFMSILFHASSVVKVLGVCHPLPV